MATSPLTALPNFHHFDAPPAWRAIEFISDLHLCAELPRTTQAWQHYLARSDADAVFILGDLFEAWVGDDARQEGFEAMATESLTRASSLRRVAFMAGNRDFLVGAEMLQACGVAALPDPTLLSAWGQRVLLTHGDALCLDDHEYQAFRTTVRGEAWRDDFLRRPLAERRELARQMRDASQASQRARGPLQCGDVDGAAAIAWMNACNSRILVHGHTHRPGSQALAPGYTRHVLCDWDQDTDAPRAQVLRLTRDGFARIDLAAS